MRKSPVVRETRARHTSPLRAIALHAIVVAGAAGAGDAPDLTIQVTDPAAWELLLNSIGVEPTTAAAAIQILVGEEGQDVGIEPTAEKVRVASIVDVHDPALGIFWEQPQDLAVYKIPSNARIFAREKRSGAPLAAGSEGWLWLALPPGENAYQRFPYIAQALRDLGLRPPTRGANLWAFFDQAYRTRADPDYLARRWREQGIAALHVSAWPFLDAAPERLEYLRNLIKACHREAVLVYAWLELPHVSEDFWAEHPDCREKTATLQDAHLDWRKLINLADPECFSTAALQVETLVADFDWAGVNLAELYFESLHGPSNPSRFTPLNEWVRADAEATLGFDPLELFDEGSEHFWSRAGASWRAFADYRAELTLSLQRRWIELLRKTRPEADLVVTQIEDRFDDRMRDFLGADAAALLPLAETYDFTLMIEDPATLWSLGPDRYPKIADAYKKLAPDPRRLAIDINIVKRYQQTYPTRKQTGGELLQLVSQAGSAFPRVALYFEHSISAADAPLLPFAAAPQARVSTLPRGGLLIESGRPVGIDWEGDVTVNGEPWPITNGLTQWLPAGRSRLEPSTRLNLAGRVLHLNAELLGADSGPGWVSFRYRSKPRPIALLDRRPGALEIDSQAAEPNLEQTKTHWALRLPRGEPCVILRF